MEESKINHEASNQVAEEEKQQEEQMEQQEIKPEQEESEQIDTNQKVIEDEVDRNPELKALKVWACKTVNTNDFVYLTVVKNLKTG